VLDLEPARLLEDPVTPAHRLELAERDRAIRSAVRALPCGVRELVLRAFFHGRTHVEIADDVGIALGTVKSRLRRALGKLEAVLAASDCGVDA